ncbi:MAG TPA: 4'-phosphopantetheinyl transferase superfamily protein [Pseudonocardiaceae bacterium]
MTDVVDLWFIRTQLPSPVLTALGGLLDADERARADAVADPERRDRFVAVHGAVRAILGRRLGVDPAGLRWTRGPHGKPELAGEPLRANVSHSGHLAVLAVTDERPVGVDVQLLPATVDAERLARRFFPPAEADAVLAVADPAERAVLFGRLWSRKEACVKAAGGQLMPGLRLPVAGDTPLVAGDPAGPLPGPFLVRDVAAPREFTAAVALAGEAGHEVVCHRWRAASALQPVPPAPSDPHPTAVPR